MTFAQSLLQNMQDSILMPTPVEGIVDVKRELVISFVQKPLVLDTQDSAGPSCFLSSDARQPHSADGLIGKVGAVIVGGQRRIAIACFAIGNNQLIDGPPEFFADPVHRASHFVFVVRMGDDKQNANWLLRSLVRPSLIPSTSEAF
jgi:hypothetical protein